MIWAALIKCYVDYVLRYIHSTHCINQPTWNIHVLLDGLLSHCFQQLHFTEEGINEMLQG